MSCILKVEIGVPRSCQQFSFRAEFFFVDGDESDDI